MTTFKCFEGFVKITSNAPALCINAMMNGNFVKQLVITPTSKRQFDIECFRGSSVLDFLLGSYDGQISYGEKFEDCGMIMLDASQVKSLIEKLSNCSDYKCETYNEQKYR